MEFVENNNTTNNNSDKLYSAIVKAAKETYSFSVIIKKTIPIQKAIESNNKKEMWDTLQLYLKKYKNFINKTTIFFNYYVYNVPDDFYNQTTNSNLIEQLKIIKTFVILYEAIHSKFKQTFEDALKKQLKKEHIYNNF